MVLRLCTSVTASRVQLKGTMVHELESFPFVCELELNGCETS